MNLREGTRRLALLLGAAGAILGGFASYSEFQTALNQRARHNKFEQLAASDAVQQERKSWALTLVYRPEEAIETFRKLPENQQRDVWSRLAKEERGYLVSRLKCEPLPSGSPSTDAVLKNLSQVDPWGKYQIIDVYAKDDPYACMAEAGDPPVSTVNEGDINTIHWTKDLGVESIETKDGLTVYPTPSPAAWIYLLIALFPVLGFLIPWGAIRGVGWVGAGFVKPIN